MADENSPCALTVTVSRQLLEKLLGLLPPDVRIIGAEHNRLTQTITLRLDAPDSPTVIEGAHLMRAILTYDPETKKSRIG